MDLANASRRAAAIYQERDKYGLSFVDNFGFPPQSGFRVNLLQLFRQMEVENSKVFQYHARVVSEYRKYRAVHRSDPDVDEGVLGKRVWRTAQVFFRQVLQKWLRRDVHDWCVALDSLD